MATEAAAGDLRVIDACRRPPGCCRVAGLATVACADVSRVLAGGLCTIVAAAAIVSDASMAEGRRAPCGRRVAGFAGVVRCNVILTLASSDCAVVTTEACAAYLRVIHAGGGAPGDDAVATLASVTGADMARIFARGRRTIVAARAITGDAVVTEVGRTPGIGCMASLATVV